MSALDILNIYISFFEKRGHKRIENSSLVPQNDPTTLFTSSGMQPIVKYLLGELHPQGKRLVNVQNCFRAQDIDEIGDNRHTTFFRMLGNWSLGDYFKNEEIPWFWELLTSELKLDPNRLYVSVFEGYKNIPRDEDASTIWSSLFKAAGIEPKGRIFYCGVEDNWWSRSGTPDHMPAGEPGGPDTEVYFDFRPDEGELKGTLDENIKAGRLLEIGNSVFMTYKKNDKGEFEELPQKNVDFGGGLERMLAAVEQKEDIFETSLFKPIIEAIQQVSGKKYSEHSKPMRIVANHFISASFIISEGVLPSNKMQGYILRRLIRNAIDNLDLLGVHNPEPILVKIIEQYKGTDPKLEENFEKIKNVMAQEHQGYKKALEGAKKFIEKESGVKIGDELKGTKEISSDSAFKALSTYGLSPTQLRSLGFNFDEQELADKIKEHSQKSRIAGEKKFTRSTNVQGKKL